MAAHALLVQRVGRDLAAATSLPLGSYNVLRLLHEAPGGRLRLSELARAVHPHPEWRDPVGEPAGEGGVVASGGARAGPARIVRRPDGSGAGRVEAGEGGVRPRTVAEQFGSHLSDAEAETLNAILGRIVTAETGADCQ